MKIPKTLARAEKLSDAFNRNLGVTAHTVSYGLEIINFAMALSELTNKSGGSTVLKAMSATGAAADMGIVVVESFGVLVREGAKAGLKRAALILGVVSGICDCIDFIASAGDSKGKHDYDSMIGNSIAAVGAAGVAVGSGIALAGLFAGGAVALGATGVGLIVVIIGAALIAVGSVLAALLTDNAYEQFAEHCFLGDSSEKIGQQFPWAPINLLLPHKDPVYEMRALVALLSNFRTDAFSWDYVRIYPGFYRDGDVFELFVRHTYNNFRLGPLVFQVLIDLQSGDVLQVAGNRPLADSSRISYDDAGRISEIKIAIEEGIPRPDLLLPFKSQIMWVRLKSVDGFTVPPREANGNDTWHRSIYMIDSLFGDSRRGSSLDTDHRASSDNEPPPRNLEPIK